MDNLHYFLTEVAVGGFLGTFNGLGPVSNLEIRPVFLEVAPGAGLGLATVFNLGLGL